MCLVAWLCVSCAAKRVVSQHIDTLPQSGVSDKGKFLCVKTKDMTTEEMKKFESGYNEGFFYAAQMVASEVIRLINNHR